jgi:hypothetical protein
MGNKELLMAAKIGGNFPHFSAWRKVRRSGPEGKKPDPVTWMATGLRLSYECGARLGALVANCSSCGLAGRVWWILA